LVPFWSSSHSQSFLTLKSASRQGTGAPPMTCRFPQLPDKNSSPQYLWCPSTYCFIPSRHMPKFKGTPSDLLNLLFLPHVNCGVSLSSRFFSIPPLMEIVVYFHMDCGKSGYFRWACCSHEDFGLPLPLSTIFYNENGFL